MSLIKWMEKHTKYLKGILITHSYFNHIYGINDLYDFNPDVKIYASKYAKEGMYSAKLNCSFYTENPFVVKCPQIKIIEENDTIVLYENALRMWFIHQDIIMIVCHFI